MGKNEYKREGFDLFDPFIVECFSSFLYTHSGFWSLFPTHAHTHTRIAFLWLRRSTWRKCAFYAEKISQLHSQLGQVITFLLIGLKHHTGSTS